MNWYKTSKMADKGDMFVQCAVCRKWATLPDNYEVKNTGDMTFDYIYKDMDDLTDEERTDWVQFKNSPYKDRISHGICPGCMKSSYGFSDEDLERIKQKHS